MMTKTAIKISSRILLFAALLVVMNYVYQFFFFENDLQKYSEVINLVRAVPDDADIIYIGESSNITFRANDIDKRPISGFVGEYFPELIVADITKPASHAGIYKVLLSNLPESDARRTIVVTLNLRSFNAQWVYSKLETALQKSMILLQDYPPLYNRFVLSFKIYDIKSDKEREEQFRTQWVQDTLRFPNEVSFYTVPDWDAQVRNNGVKNPDSSRNEELTTLACHYIKAYAFQIDTVGSPRTRDINDIIELAEQRGWNLIFNLLAENTEKAQELVGDDLLFLMEQNRILLIDYLQKRGIKVVDNLYAIESEQFIDQNWTTEHYAEKGRKIIAANVAGQLQQFYSEEFSNIDIVNRIQTSFFNDCEGKLIWGQMGTLSDEQAFSGKYASKTGKGDEYGLTFEYPFTAIPDSMKNTLKIDFKVFQYSAQHDAKLVIQAQGKNMQEYWNGILLTEQIQGVEKWEDFQYMLQIPDNIKQAELIKVYVFNPSNEIIYIDDFEVVFE